MLLRMVQHIEEHIELYCIGQTMSRGAQENNGSGFGDRGRADFAQSTKFQITKRDAAKFGDTMTDDVLSVMKRWSFPPEMQEIPARVVYNVDVPDPKTWMESAKLFIDMGGKIREDEARTVTGMSSPHEGDAILGGQQPMPPGAGGGMPSEGKPGEANGKPTNGKPGKPSENTTGVAGVYSNGKVVPETNGAPAHDRFEMPPEPKDKYNRFKRLIQASRRKKK